MIATLLLVHLPAVLAVASHPSTVDVSVFAVASAIVLAGGVGVVVARNPVHAALMLVMTLFGVAVLFVLQRDDFLAAVQVIVYAGAIVVLFLFVIMFLGVDKEENLRVEPLRGQRPVAVALGLLALVGTLVLGSVSHWTTGAHAVSGPADAPGGNVALLGRSVFTTYLFPFEVTAALLVIAVVGAVVLARRPPATRPEGSPGAAAMPVPGSGEGGSEDAEDGAPADAQTHPGAGAGEPDGTGAPDASEEAPAAAGAAGATGQAAPDVTDAAQAAEGVAR
ncbi:MAG: NADH-quinone oxidoreductase subunit J [Actinomycetota bacterium]|nr:NADH-quinone oxidoreductase subunit J [Actinomycetota bacterium]